MVQNNATRWVGVNGLQIANGINQYSWYNCLNLNASWNVSNNDLLSKIEKMLDKNYPVTFSIGPVGKCYCGIWLFTNSIAKDDDKYNFEVQSLSIYCEWTLCNHNRFTDWMTLKENFLNFLLGPRVLCEFLMNILGTVGITSNIVYIELNKLYTYD